jgi:hypothetical protein
MAIRMDLGYKKQLESLPDGQGPVDLDEAISHREVLFMTLRNIFPESLISSAWKLEHCREKGYGYHLLLLFDGCLVSDDVGIARTIGDLWDVSVTQGAGVHLCLNAMDRNSTSYGLGVIFHRRTKVFRYFKERVITYMARANYFMQTRSEIADQAFGIVRFANLSGVARADNDTTLLQHSTD